ncbi:MAG: TetR/AcrR family transcriptional regulator [Proteobacteria bacterium]|nr:MAG: TetR/AcrR family transcriptional regulator [Pseudomonadota bacterium]
MARKSSPKRLQPELSSKERLVDAYISLAYEVGVAHITLQKIADKAGIGFSTVRYYFTQDSFDIHGEAFKRVMLRSLESVERAVWTDKRSLVNPVHAYVDSIFDWINEDRINSTYLIYAYYSASSALKTSVDLSEVNENARRKIQSALLESIGLEIYKPVKDAQACASSIHACVVGHGFVAMTASSRDAFKTFKVQCLSTVHALIVNSAKS